MDQLNKRNTETVEQVLKEMNTKLYDMQSQLNKMHASLSGMSERMNALEKMVIMQKVYSTSSGPSVR